eukprot:EG_transcript_1415
MRRRDDSEGLRNGGGGSDAGSDDVARPLLDDEPRAAGWPRRFSLAADLGFVSKSRFSVHVLLCIAICTLLTVEAVVYAQYHNGVLRSSVQAFWHHFLPKDQNRGTAVLADIPSTLDFLERTTREYYDIANKLPGVFRFCLRGPCTPTPAPVITVWSMGDAGTTKPPRTCYLTPENPQGPFGNCSDVSAGCHCKRHLARKTVRIEVAFELISTPPWVMGMQGQALFKCFNWKLKQAYDLSRDTGLFTVTLHWDYQECTSRILERIDRTVVFWISLLIALCALVDIALRAPVVASLVHHFQRRWGRARGRPRPPLSDLSASPLGFSAPSPSPLPFPAVRVSHWWLAWALCGDVLCLCSSVAAFVTLSVMEARSIIHLRWLVLGLAALMQFTLLSSFLEHDPRLYLLFNTLHTAAPVLAAFILSSMPVFMAFALFGTVVFGKHSDLFHSLGAASATLFAVLNGDSIEAAFTSTHDANTAGVAFLSRVYVFAFTLLSIYVVANVSRVIIVEAYNHITLQVHGEALASLAAPLGHLSVQSTPTGSRTPLWRTASPPLPDPHFTLSGGVSRTALLHFGLTALLAGLLLFEVDVNISSHNKRVQDTESTLKGFFLPQDEMDPLSSSRAYLYTMESSVDHLRDSVERYYDLNATTPSFYEHHQTAHGLPEPPLLRLEYLRHGSFAKLEGISLETDRLQCPLFPKSHVGPFGRPLKSDDPCDHIPDIAARVLWAEVAMTFRTRPRSFTQPCIEWDLAVLYDFSSRVGVVPVTIRLDYMACPTVKPTMLLRSTTVWICFAVCLLSLCNLTLRRLRTYREVLGKSWQRWHAVTMALNVVWAVENTVYRSTSKQPSEGLVDMNRIFLGVTCAFNWLLLIGYLETQPAFQHLGSTLRNALPVARNFVIGALPLFFGYCMFGVIFFGRVSYHFSSLEQAAVTLFSVLNGDVVLDIFEALQDPNSEFVSVCSALYIFSFIPLMIYGIVNIFLVITEESYRHVVQGASMEGCLQS